MLTKIRDERKTPPTETFPTSKPLNNVKNPKNAKEEEIIMIIQFSKEMKLISTKLNPIRRIFRGNNTIKDI